MIAYEGDTVSIVKFLRTGVVELCQEVAGYVEREEYIKDGVDINSAQFVKTDTLYKVVFQPLGDDAA